MPEITADDITRAARDAFYVGVGAGVLTFQKAQVKRVEVTEAVREAADGAKGRVEDLTTDLESFAADLRARLEGLLGSVEADEVVAEVVRNLREAAREAADQVRGALRAA